MTTKKTRQEFLVEKLAEQLTNNKLIEHSKFNGMTITFGRLANGTVTVRVNLGEHPAKLGTFISGTARQLADAVKLGFTVHEPPTTKGSTDQSG